MNYLKWTLYAVIFMLFFYPLMEIQAFNGSVFASSFFTSTGFIVTLLFALSTLYFVVYSFEFGKKKDVEETKGK